MNQRLRTTEHSVQDRVLVVCHDPVILCLFERILRLKNFEVIAKEFGKIKPSHIVENPPSAIIIEVDFYKTGNHDFFTAIKNFDEIKSVPILATSPHWLDHGESLFLVLGYDALIKQPIDIGTISAVIHSAIMARVGLLQTYKAKA
jgi:response regulator RpfG family c-di-GMP phosphodiesterase